MYGLRIRQAEHPGERGQRYAPFEVQPEEQAVLDSQAAQGVGQPLMGFAAERQPFRVGKFACRLVWWTCLRVR